MFKRRDRKPFDWKRFLYRTFVGETAARKLFLFYLYAIIIGIILLALPISLKNINSYTVTLYDGTVRPYTFVDIFFTAISAFSDTGLTSFCIQQSYNLFGQIVIMLLIQVGGLGLFTIYWILWNIAFNNYIYKKIKHLPLYEKNKIGFSNSLLIASERGNSKLGLSNQTIKSAVIFIITTEIIFTFIYSLWFGLVPTYQQVNVSSAPLIYLNNSNVALESSNWTVNGTQLNPQYHNAGLAIWTGIFQSVSTMNNAGFDVIGNSSLSAFRNGSGTVFQYIVILQFMIGGIGYPVIYDCMQYIKKRYRHQRFRFSLFTKVSVVTYFLVAFIGLIFMLGFEFGLQDSLIYKVNHCKELADYFGTGTQKGWNEFTYVVFNVFTARSAGFATVSENEISAASKWIMIILMFIGCAPSSTGGGIRTTTLAVMVMATISKANGYKDTRIFKRSILSETVINSFLITIISVVLIVGLSLISYPLILNIQSNSEMTVTDAIFEFSSAYGTVGLTSGISTALNSNNVNVVFIAIFLSLIMIIGQLGIPASLFVFKRRKTSKAIEYPTEDIRIG